MIVETTVDRIIDQLSYTELQVVKALSNHIQGDSVLLVISSIMDVPGITRSIAVNSLSKLSAAGVIETRSLGRSGTFIRLLNREAFDVIALTEV